VIARLSNTSPFGISRTALACGFAALLLCATFAGCAISRPDKVALPARHSIRADQLLVVSDFKIAKEHPLLQDLILLRQKVSQQLELPLSSKPVMVYLFSNELEYNQYWQATYPGYPLRRAYFIQTPNKELAVYTSWSEKIQEDLRHEFTHGLLHASLETVPLWIDEGLAEYFEVKGQSPGQVNADYVRKLATMTQNGWRPDMARLERLEKVEQMQRTDYREAWAWTHFMLHDSPESRRVLLDYLKELRDNPHPDRLSDKLADAVGDPDGRLLHYVAALAAPPEHTAVRPVSATVP